MKVKTILVSGNLSWSPQFSSSSIYLSTGTAAQQLDASFSTNSSLDIYSLDVGDFSLEMPQVGSLSVQNRFHSLMWGNVGENGVIAGGSDGGAITFYDPKAILKSSGKEIFCQKNSHSGPVQTLDFNGFQSHLMASGASESEIFIWDLNKLESPPMSPGSKVLPSDDVRSVNWNSQVQHILASTFASRCVIWDLRKSDPIIKISSSSRVRYKATAWHPNVATQLCLASEDEYFPAIEMWDLRYASSPLTSLLRDGSRGVLSLSWSPIDSDLLLSAGKDNSVLCWDPNVAGGEFLGEIASCSQWVYDVSWCPANPAVFAAASFDGYVSVYSLLGGQRQEDTRPEVSSAIADSFPGVMPVHQPIIPPSSTSHSSQLSKPPKWLKRPCGANFGFGGRLVTFGLISLDSSVKKSSVSLSSVITESKLIERSVQLETSLDNYNLTEFCELKIANSFDEEDKEAWSFIQACFSSNSKDNYLELLGIKNNDSPREPEVEKPSSVEDSIFDRLECRTIEFKTEGKEGALSRALLSGNIQEAVSICLEQNRMSDALLLSLQGGEDLYNTTKAKYLESSQSPEIELIKAVVSSNQWPQLIARMDPIKNWKEGLVAAIAYSSSPEELSTLCSSLASKLSGHPALLCYICAGDIVNVIRIWMEGKCSSLKRDEENQEDSTSNLQDLIEVVMILHKGFEESFGNSVLLQNEILLDKLTSYAHCLASQGALTSSLTYLSLCSSVERVSELRDRVHGALGMKKRIPIQQQQQQQQKQQQQQQRFIPGTQYHYNGSSTPAVNPYNPYVHSGPSLENVSQQQQQQHISQIPASSMSSYTGWNDPPPLLPRTKVKEGPKTYNNTTTTSTEPLPYLYTPSNDYVGQLSMSRAGSGAPLKCEPLIPGSLGASSLHEHPSLIPGPPGASSLHEPYSQYGAPRNEPPSCYTLQNQPIPKLFAPTNPNGYGVTTPTPMMSSSDNNNNKGQHTFSEAAVEVVSKAKEPIPEKHLILQEVFEGLRLRCLQSANHPQIKRKLEDVSKKLEILYDKLRDNSLPSGTLDGLHDIPSYLQQKDYNSCILHVNQLVSTGSFTILSGFLPGIKVLLQVASQLGVHYDF